VVLSQAGHLIGAAEIRGLFPSRPIPDLDAAGLSRIVSALRGGAGAEFITAIQRQTNPLSLIRTFTTGRRTEVLLKGVAIKLAKSSSEFGGRLWDQLNGLMAGAVLTPRGLSLGAMMRGPIDAPVYAEYVWAFDRGAGTTLEAPFATRGGIRYDSEVVVIRQTDGTLSGEVRDLISGERTALDAASIKVEGPTIRLVMPASLLPSQGLAVNKYRASFFIRDADASGIEHVASFVPERSMFMIGDIRPAAGVRR
jgi:hypothetical protein